GHHLRPTRPGESGSSIALPEWPDLDPPKAGHGMFSRDGYRLVEGRALEEIEARDPFLRLGEGAVGLQDLVPPLADGHRLVYSAEPVAHYPDSQSVHLGDPGLDVVLGWIVFLRRGIGAHEHHVPHHYSFSPFNVGAGCRSTVKSSRRRSRNL